MLSCILTALYGGLRRCSTAEGKAQALEDECSTLLNLFNLVFLQPSGKPRSYSVEKKITKLPAGNATGR